MVEIFTAPLDVVLDVLGEAGVDADDLGLELPQPAMSSTVTDASSTASGFLTRTSFPTQ
jgi:hypothetical protein